MIFTPFRELLLLTIILVVGSISDEFENEETRWTFVREFVDPVVISRHVQRHRRSTLSNNVFDESDEILMVSIGNWTLKTVRNDRFIVSPKFQIHWIDSKERSVNNFSTVKHYSDCDVRQGHVVNDESSIVVLTICSDEFYVMINVDDCVFYVRPAKNGRHVLEQTRTRFFEDNDLPGSLKTRNSTESHKNGFPETKDKISATRRSAVSNRSTDYSDMTRRKKRESGRCRNKGFYNLTGDTFELEDDTRPVNVQDLAGKDESVDDEEAESEEDTGEDIRGGKGTDNVGYFFDRTWEKTKLPKRKIIGKDLPPRWLELAISIDYSVIDFHGQRVQQYVLALFNIVSAIYKDPSLDSNLRLVIVRMVFYSEKVDGMVRQGNAKKSLENVNKWNRKLLSAPDENHDVAVWLTRLDIGGPSGYAPVSGVCDPARSCALNRDEGLTSAFIIAHEVAHTLGLTHDGDESSGNSCGEEASMGSVMAPMVAATFHRFHWSSCSRKEFHRYAKHFECLDNKPSDGNSTRLGHGTSRETFTMDEQCRMEFGEGYALCRSFELPGPCSHLWCGHASVSEVCKTKKGPPLEGTVCGKNKWCVNGYCEFMDRRRFGVDRTISKPRDGGWGPWTSWGKCSRSCGVGVRFRFRQCNEPTPAFGGKYCEGNSEDFAICEQANCTGQIDVRQQQCQRLPSLLRLEETSPKFSMTWLPHQPDEDHLKCRISCRSAETNEIFLSQEFLPDGTPCSYGATDICVQGTCRQMGCDKILNSAMKHDSCGVCNGDDTTCSRHVNKFNRKIRRAKVFPSNHDSRGNLTMTSSEFRNVGRSEYGDRVTETKFHIAKETRKIHVEVWDMEQGMTRVAIIPRDSYNVSVDVKIAAKSSLAHDNLTFTIRDGRRRRNDLNDFDSSGNGQILIVEGAAFRSRRFGDAYEIFTKGPVLTEIIVSLAVPDYSVKSGVTISVTSRYIVNRKNSGKKTKYSWIFGGWSPCSASCGGGTRHKTIACKDDETGRIANRKKCSLMTKPLRHIEKCNNFSCRYKWIPGPWEDCTATCGSQGVQHRDIFCIHTSFGDKNMTNDNELAAYKIMVSPIRCKGERHPETKRQCNRIPCSGNWIVTPWSSARKKKTRK